jgi:hypothetical protein
MTSFGSRQLLQKGMLMVLKGTIGCHIPLASGCAAIILLPTLAVVYVDN